MAVALIEATGSTYFVTSMGKGSVSEHLSTFGGVYGGATSSPAIKNAVETSDCVFVTWKLSRVSSLLFWRVNTDFYF
jgi:pyruvate decarboxylase